MTRTLDHHLAIYIYSEVLLLSVSTDGTIRNTINNSLQEQIILICYFLQLTHSIVLHLANIPEVQQAMIKIIGKQRSYSTNNGSSHYTSCLWHQEYQQKK